MNQKTRDLAIIVLLTITALSSFVAATKSPPTLSTLGLREAVKDALKDCDFVETTVGRSSIGLPPNPTKWGWDCEVRVDVFNP